MEKWYVMFVKSQNGTRIGINQEPLGEILRKADTEDEAHELCEKLSIQYGVPQFDNNEDVVI
jgi:hypothetical protein